MHNAYKTITEALVMGFTNLELVTHSHSSRLRSSVCIVPLLIHLQPTLSQFYNGGGGRTSMCQLHQLHRIKLHHKLDRE